MGNVVVVIASGATVTVTKPDSEPPQVSVYVNVPGPVGVMIELPEYAVPETVPVCTPLQLPPLLLPP